MAVPVPSYFPGMQGLRGYNLGEPEAPPEQVHGRVVNPSHGVWGEQAQPYSWQSQLMNYSGHSGPYGSESAMYEDPTGYYGMPAGQLHEDPRADMVPYRGHAAPTNVTLSGALPSQYDAINGQLVQGAENRGTDLGASRKDSLYPGGDPRQDHWQEVWDVSVSPELYPVGQPWSDTAQFGIGVNDRITNPLKKVNAFGFDKGHHHRRFAIGSIPGNYMWLRPGGRPEIKSLPGPARPATGEDSPFTGDDLGASFGIQGAVLVQVPSEYQPPPSPQLSKPVNYDEPAPGIPIW
jgi:hypothetical protein